MLKTLLLAALAVLLGLCGALLGARWLSALYETGRAALTFPKKIFAQEKKHARILSGVLAFLFCFTLLLKHETLAPLALAFLLIFAFFLTLVTLTDLEQQVIFDKMLLPFALLGLLAAPALGEPFLDHLLAGALGLSVFFALAVLTRGGVGGGDVKLLATLGLWLGTEKLFCASVLGILLGGIIAALLLVTKRLRRGEAFAYGPCFTVAALLITLFS